MTMRTTSSRHSLQMSSAESEAGSPAERCLSPAGSMGQASTSGCDQTQQQPNNDLMALMSHLSEEERLKIAAVLQRDLDIKKAEQQRITAKKLTIAAYADDLEHRNRRLAEKKNRTKPMGTGALLTQVERKCAICAGKLGYLKKQGLVCTDCHNRICSDCSRWWYCKQTKVRVCRLCHMTREYTATSGKWAAASTSPAATPVHRRSRDSSCGPVMESTVHDTGRTHETPAFASPSETFFESIKQCTPHVEESLHLLTLKNKRRQSISNSLLDVCSFGAAGRRKSFTSLEPMPNEANKKGKRKCSAGGVLNVLRRKSSSANVSNQQQQRKSNSADVSSSINNSLSINGLSVSACTTPTVERKNKQSLFEKAKSNKLPWRRHRASADMSMLRTQSPNIVITISDDATMSSQPDNNNDAREQSPNKNEDLIGAQSVPTHRRKSWTNVFTKKREKDIQPRRTSDESRKTCKSPRSVSPASNNRHKKKNSLLLPGDDDNQSDLEDDHSPQRSYSDRPASPKSPKNKSNRKLSCFV